MKVPVRVLRVLEYVGDREWVENTIELSIQGVRAFHDEKRGVGGEVRAATVGVYPDYVIEDEAPPESLEKQCPLCGVALGGDVAGVVIEADGKEQICCESCAIGREETANPEGAS